MLFLLLGALALGCMSSAKNVPSRYSPVFDADRPSTPPARNRRRSKSACCCCVPDAEFMDADFFSLQNDAKSVLGNSLLDSDQFFRRAVPAKARRAKRVGCAHRRDRRVSKSGRQDPRISLPLPEPTETTSTRYGNSRRMSWKRISSRA